MLFKKKIFNNLNNIIMKPFINGLVVGYLFKERIKEIVGHLVVNTLKKYHEIRGLFIKNNNPNTNLIKSIHFVFKITDHDAFNEYFKNNRTNNITLQPKWDFYKLKNVIKIQLDDDFIDYLNTNLIGTKGTKGTNGTKGTKGTNGTNEISFNDFINIKNNKEYYVTLDIPFFESFGQVYLYVNYKLNDKRYINVYNTTSTISSSDFSSTTELSNTNLFKSFFNNVLCSTITYKTTLKLKTEYTTNYFKMFTNNPDKVIITPEILLINYDNIDVDLNIVSLNFISINSENKKYIITDNFINNEDDNNLKINN